VRGARSIDASLQAILAASSGGTMKIFSYKIKFCSKLYPWILSKIYLVLSDCIQYLRIRGLICLGCDRSEKLRQCLGAIYLSLNTLSGNKKCIYSEIISNEHHLLVELL